MVLKELLWQNKETKAMKQGKTPGCGWTGHSSLLPFCFLLQKSHSDPMSPMRNLVVSGKRSEKHDKQFNQQHKIKPIRINTEALPVRRLSLENLSWKISLTCLCDHGAFFHWEALLFSLDLVHKGLCVQESHRGAQRSNIHLVTYRCKEGSLTQHLSPKEALVRRLQFASRWI